ncbi:hypothetical protein GMB86_08915 [Terrilactibacillus sp. BCM23-1]|uniref:YtxH domain-containing protein n=1 Tax=Terrilactibacillus tamarindi TaxID=2599694 RepID=A0A6N8CSE9_9BACI|nr:hypothetical protein [Terrilactibacillus tamarindi]MTT32127.1 hypothetical protein [Terrilactibacillus tamarindi]
MGNNKSTLRKYALIGGLLGASVSLMNKESRRSLKQTMKTASSNCGKLIYTLWTNPNKVSQYIKSTGNNMRLMAQEVSDDFSKMVNNVDQVRKSSSEAVNYAIEAGSELTDIASKIKNSSQSVIPTNFGGQSSNLTPSIAQSFLDSPTNLTQKKTTPVQSATQTQPTTLSTPKSNVNTSTNQTTMTSSTNAEDYINHLPSKEKEKINSVIEDIKSSTGAQKNSKPIH